MWVSRLGIEERGTRTERQDPALELSTLNAPNSEHVRRKEQPLFDSIVRGEHAGGYYLIVGPKGCGKGTMVLE